MDLHVKISQVVVVWDGTDSRDTTHTLVRHPWAGQRGERGPYGSAMRRSVSLIILLGRAISVVGGRVRHPSSRLLDDQGSGLDGEEIGRAHV